jgi:hypothetical protein
LSATIVMPSTMRRDTVRPVVEAAVASVAGMEGGEVILVANGPEDGRRRLDFRSPRLQGRLPAEEDAIASRLRQDGIGFRDGLQTMETIALGAVDRETAGPRD